MFSMFLVVFYLLFLAGGPFQLTLEGSGFRFKGLGSKVESLELKGRQLKGAACFVGCFFVAACDPAAFLLRYV